MAKGMYIGVDDKARKVKKMYIGTDNVARKIKKGYVGVANVARVFWSAMVEKLNIYHDGSFQNGVFNDFEYDADTLWLRMRNDGVSTSGTSHSYDHGWLFLDGVTAGDSITIDFTWYISARSSNQFSGLGVVFRDNSGDTQLFYETSGGKNAGEYIHTITHNATKDGMWIFMLDLTGEHHEVTTSVTINKITMNGKEIFPV